MSVYELLKLNNVMCVSGTVKQLPVNHVTKYLCG